MQLSKQKAKQKRKKVVQVQQIANHALLCIRQTLG